MPRNDDAASPYALFRLQAQPSGTWYWAVHFSRHGQRHYRRFYDPKYSGPAKAKKAAIAWRDEQLASIPALSVVEFCQHQRSNNTSGVPGVHFLKSESQPEGIWQAKLKLDGRARHRSFSVRRYGYEAAFAKAVAARQELLASAEDRLYLYDSLAKRKAMPARPHLPDATQLAPPRPAKPASV